MTLTRRLTLFFLVALAAVLAAFSVALDLLARAHLWQTLDDKLAATTNLLIAAAEVDDRGVEWEAEQRLMRIVRDPAAPVRWVVRGDRPLERDRSDDPESEPLPDFPRDVSRTFHHRDSAGVRWRIRQTTIRSDGPSDRPPSPPRHTQLTFTVAVGVEPTERLLSRMELTLAGVSASVLVFAALLSRWLIRRALVPVRDMAATASAVTATDLAVRLPEPAPPDELRELATAFNELLARVQVAFERQASFTGEASHQLRTPLTALMGQLEVALRRDRSPDEYRHALTIAHREANRLHQLVESLLFLARADGESRMPDTEPLDLNAWLRAHFAASWADHPRYADLIVIGTSGSTPTLVAVHPPLFGQAINNVVDNAFKYSPSGTPVTVTVARRGETALVTVDDFGPGIPEAERGRVFEPFFRSTDARRRGVEGVGLGLAVTARIVHAFGGKVAALSRPSGIRTHLGGVEILPADTGTRIAVVLPAVGG